MAMAETDKLVMMANQIAQFFRSYPHEEAVAGIAAHIEAFWTPRMIGVLRANAGDAAGLDALAAEALAPAVDATAPAEKVAMGPGKLGELGAVDAG